MYDFYCCPAHRGRRRPPARVSCAKGLRVTTISVRAGGVGERLEPADEDVQAFVFSASVPLHRFHASNCFIQPASIFALQYKSSRSVVPRWVELLADEPASSSRSSPAETRRRALFLVPPMRSIQLYSIPRRSKKPVVLSGDHVPRWPTPRCSGPSEAWRGATLPPRRPSEEAYR